jgi:hypothetical protein
MVVQRENGDRGLSPEPAPRSPRTMRREYDLGILEKVPDERLTIGWRKAAP